MLKRLVSTPNLLVTHQFNRASDEHKQRLKALRRHPFRCQPPACTPIAQASRAEGLEAGLYQTAAGRCSPLGNSTAAQPRSSVRCSSAAQDQPADRNDSGANEPAAEQVSSSPGGGAASNIAPDTMAGQSSYVQASWAEMLLAMPLELAAASAKVDSHWLHKRKRKHWWSREQFPRVPIDTMEDVHKSMQEKGEPPVKLWRKLIPLALIFFCASFNLTILQNLKDAIVVTSAGAEALPFLASFCVLPASLAFFFAYGRMVEFLPQRAVFYASVAPLVAFYAFFASILYPASVHLHPHGFYERMAPLLPIGLHGLLKVIEHWTFSMFFCVAELWGSVVISVLFWTLANDKCTVEDAKIFYPLMGIAANVALVVAGNYMKWVNASFTQGSLLLSLRFLVTTVVVLSAVMMGAKAYVDANIKSVEVADKAPAKKKKKKGSMADSIAVLQSSPKILNLALLVVSYGVSHRLFEFAWKGQLRALYPSAQQYQGMLADVSIATGYATITLMLTGRFVFQYLGWGIAAAATPVVMLLAGSIFFTTSIMSQAGPAASQLAAAGATAGAITQVFARSSKFSLFDPAKEMVFIELSKEEKSKGKAAVDLVGSQIGKSGASWLTQALLLITGSIQAALPIIAGLFTMVIACWIRAVSILHNTIKREEAAAAAAKAAAAKALAEGMSSDDEELPPETATSLTSAAASESSAIVDTSGHHQADSGSHSVSPPRWPGSFTDAISDAEGRTDESEQCYGHNGNQHGFESESSQPNTNGFSVQKAQSAKHG